MVPARLDIDGLPERLTVDGFWATFGRIEHEALDFKRGVSGEILDTIPAMAMTDGGLIVHGVDRDLNIVGCPLSQNTFDRITRFANECNVEVQVRAFQVGDAELTVTAVPEVRQRIVTAPDGRLLRRVGGDCQPLRGDMFARFVREREGRSGEDEQLAYDLESLDLARVNEALAANGRAAVRRARVPRALVDLGVALTAEPPLRALRAAVLLFATDPRRSIPGAAVRLVRREGIGPGPGPSRAREECAGPLLDVLERCLRFIEQHTRRHEVVVGVQREALPEYPDVVIREAMLNALAHRDYGLTGATTDITIWDDRLEIRSPGPLPGHITVENMREEHYSRNRRLMGVLQKLGLVEEFGEGVDRMFREMDARLMTPPDINATSGSVTVTLYNRVLVSIDDQAWMALLADFPMTRDERLALVETRRRGTITRRRLREMLPESDPGDILAGAVAKGLLVRTGRRGGTRYELSHEVVLRAGSEGMEAQRRRRQTLLNEIERRGSLSTAEAARLLDGDKAAIRALLNELAAAGIVRAAGKTRARRYYPVSADHGAGREGGP